MNPLPLHQAIKLYNIIAEHLPDEIKDEDAYEYIHAIMSSMKDKNKHVNYIEAIATIIGEPIEELFQYSTEEIINMFMEGLAVNKIVQLKSFMDEITHD